MVKQIGSKDERYVVKINNSINFIHSKKDSCEKYLKNKGFKKIKFFNGLEIWGKDIMIKKNILGRDTDRITAMIGRQTPKIEVVWESDYKEYDMFNNREGFKSMALSLGIKKDEVVYLD